MILIMGRYRARCKQLFPSLRYWARILVQVTIYRRLQIGRDGHLDQTESYDIS